MARRRIDDRDKAGRSDLVPFIENESPSDRHARRKAAAVERVRHVESWCRSKGVKLTRSNDDHHWTFRRGKWIAEWWPSSAKLVIRKQWNRGIHVHDHVQASKAMERDLERSRG